MTDEFMTDEYSAGDLYGFATRQRGASSKMPWVEAFYTGVNGQHITGKVLQEEHVGLGPVNNGGMLRTHTVAVRWKGMGIAVYRVLGRTRTVGSITQWNTVCLHRGL